MRQLKSNEVFAAAGALGRAWGKEYSGFSPAEYKKLLTDFVNAAENENKTFDEMASLYVRRIHRGNLRSYVKTLMVNRKQNPKKNPNGKPFIIFAYHFRWKEPKVRYAYNNAGRVGWTGTKSKAIDFKTASEAMKHAEHYANSVSRTAAVGVINKNTTKREVLAFVEPVKKPRKKNPVGPTQKEVDAASELFRDFRGDHPEQMKKVRMKNPPKVGLVVGELDGVLYTTVRDGKTEHYQHDFRKASRPLLVSAHDGESLHILGGEYEFTERGIEDR